MSLTTVKTCLRIAALLVASTLLIAIFNADLTLSRLFYTPGQGFLLASAQPWRALYKFGEYPGLLLAIAAALAVAATFRWPGYRAWRKPCLFLALLYLLGPGLMINAVLKDHWGRARPVDITRFGGNQVFLQPWVPSPHHEGKSFPSGHASVAFFLIGPYFILRQRRPAAAFAWLAAGSAYGSLVGLARVIQGGHFLSDVLWSGGLVVLTGIVLADLLHLDKQPALSLLPEPDTVSLPSSVHASSISPVTPSPRT